MIFRRSKRRADADEAAAPESETDLDPTTAGDEDATELSADDPAGDGEDGLDLAALDAEDWRTEGPWDIAEVEELESTPERPLIDLGSMVLTGFPGVELRLQIAEETSQIVSAMLISGDSALELGAYAAPRSGGLWAELREEIMAGATEAGGSAGLAEGPFGVELRRLVPVTTPEGEQGYQPSRMWVAEGPRWLLRGIVYGQAALEEGVDGPVAPLLAAFRDVVVRRGDEPMAPGDLLPLTMPADLVAADAPPA